MNVFSLVYFHNMYNRTSKQAEDLPLLAVSPKAFACREGFPSNHKDSFKSLAVDEYLNEIVSIYP